MLFKISYGNTVPYNGDVQETPAPLVQTQSQRVPELKADEPNSPSVLTSPYFQEGDLHYFSLTRGLEFKGTKPKIPVCRNN